MRLPFISMFLREAEAGGIPTRSKVSRMVGIVVQCYGLPYVYASMKYVLTSGILAAGTISGLGTYFLGLSSLSGNLANDDPVQRVILLKRQLGLGSTLARGTDPNVRSLWNLADPDTCPPGTPPPGFQNGDEVSCLTVAEPVNSTNGTLTRKIHNLVFNNRIT